MSDLPDSIQCGPVELYRDRACWKGSRGDLVFEVWFGETWEWVLSERVGVDEVEFVSSVEYGLNFSSPQEAADHLASFLRELNQATKGF